MRNSLVAYLLLVLVLPIFIYVPWIKTSFFGILPKEESRQTPHGSEWDLHEDPDIQRAFINSNTFSCEFCPQFRTHQSEKDRSTRDGCKSHDPVNLEPPRLNSLTGPRKIPFIKGAKSCVSPLRSPRKLKEFYQFSLVTHPAKPTLSLTSSRLISIAVGEAGRQNVRNIVHHFGLKDFAYLFFVYDASDWRNETFYNQSVFISAFGQMKWWYIKRFITPQLARSYEFIFAIDEDMDPKYIQVDGLLAILRTHKIQLAQPAMMPGNVNHDIKRIVQQYVICSNLSLSANTSNFGLFCSSDQGIVGRWTDFVECGPFVIISSEAYDNCIWDLIQEDLTSGWGLDFLWHYYCKSAAGIDKTAIIDRYPQIHMSLKTASKSNATRRHFEPYSEMLEYRRRFSHIKETERKVFDLIRYIDLEHQGEPNEDWDP